MALKKASNARLIGIAGIAIGLAVMFKITTTVNERLAAIPVTAVPQKSAKLGELNTKSLYPVVVTLPQAKGTDSGDSSNLDAVFMDRPSIQQQIQKVQQEARPDFKAIFTSSIRVDGTTSSGAFINGTFRSVGEEMKDLALTNGTITVTPKLSRVRKGVVLITFGSDGRLEIGTEE